MEIDEHSIPESAKLTALRHLDLFGRASQEGPETIAYMIYYGIYGLR